MPKFNIMWNEGLERSYCGRLHHMDDIMHKWANPHFDDFEKKIAQQHGVQDKTNKYKLTQKGNKISDQMV